ncbi:MAG: phosphoribosyltransferase family protein [Chloroherpetonaceae bacterium]|nr:phosphoribosyltransferase family protein [Chthonomonadaceae bacterium]MDW8209228.1 phosphoribosyltransferase family protein [Chloroherpetonaceae bacterium]
MYLSYRPAKFLDRRDAGRQLARQLQHLRGTFSLVLALPRGGVPVGYEVAHSLDAPLEVMLAHKLGVPMQPELAFGAIAEGGVIVLNEPLIAELQLTPEVIASIAAAEEEAMEERRRLFRGGRPLPDVTGRVVVLVDDGLATGMTAWAAVRAVRQAGAQRIVLAVPVRAAQIAPGLVAETDEIVSVLIPEAFHAVGIWYTDFEQVADAEVVALLQQRRLEMGHAVVAPEAGQESGSGE